jgi:hypothetical protein
VFIRELDMKRTGRFFLVTSVLAGMLIAISACGGGGSSGVPPLPVVAVLSNEAATPFAADVVEKLEATGKFSLVDTINAATSTPALPQLLTYDGVLVYTGDNGPALADTTALGNILADFVDQDGGLVVAFAAVVYNPGLPEFALGGRYVSDQYYLIPRVTHTIGSQVSGAVLDSTHPILNGFNSFASGNTNAWADTSLVVPGATVILEWADGTPLVVTDETGGVRRVDLNFYPPSSESPDNRLWDATTDGDLLMANALMWVADLP